MIDKPPPFTGVIFEDDDEVGQPTASKKKRAAPDPELSAGGSSDDDDDDGGAGAGAPKADGQSPRFILTRFKDFALPEGDDYCVKGVLPGTGLAVVWGAPKCGKSFWIFDLLMHVVLNWEYRGHRVKQGAAVYVCLEGDRGFRKRREAFRLGKLQGDEDPAFYITTNSLLLATDHKKLIADIQMQMGLEVPAVVCIDTLNRSLEGSESSDKDMAVYIRAADAVRDAFDCLVIIVHHCGYDQDHPRGHTSLAGAVDTQIAVYRDEEGNIIAEIEVAKDGEPGRIFVSRLERIEIMIDKDGDPITSCIIEPVGDDPVKAAARKRGKGKRNDDIAKIKRAMMDAYHRLVDGTTTTLGLDGKPVRKLEITKLRDELKSRGFLEVDDKGALTAVSRAHFRRAKVDLIDGKSFIENAGFFWKA
jgi:hypothetical protein